MCRESKRNNVGVKSQHACLDENESVASGPARTNVPDGVNSNRTAHDRISRQADECLESASVAGTEGIS